MSTQKTWFSLGLASTPRSFRFSLVFAGVCLGLYGVGLFYQSIFPVNSLSTNVVSVLITFGSFVLSWVGVKRFQEQGDIDPVQRSLERRLHFWVPLVFSSAMLFQGASTAIFVYDDLHSLGNATILGMIVILGMYPALLAGIFLLPRDVLSGKVPLRFVMESLMIIATLLTFSWYFLLGPLLLQSQGAPVIEVAINVVYAIFNLLILSCLILLSRSIADHALRRSINLLSLSMILFVLTDNVMLFQTLYGPPNTSLLRIGWLLGTIISALSLQMMRWQKTPTISKSLPQASTLVATPLWRTIILYTLVPLVLVLVIFLWDKDRNSVLSLGTYACALLLLIFLFIKQFLAVQEVHGLNQGFERLQHMIDEKNEALQQANTRLEALATTDPLTELPNHRALVNVLDQELARSHQYQRSCSLLFFDLDHFKALNDGYGHAGGDVALREFGSLLRATLPLINTVGRWGGEEFIAILPEQDASAAAMVAEELRSAVANHSFSIGGGMHLTCSIGVASSPAHGLHQGELLQAADSAMYAAKRLGRNQVRLIDDPEVIALLETTAAVEGREDVALLGTVQALELLMEKRDARAREHAQQVGELLLHLAQSSGLSEAEAQHLSLAGQLHDIGKIVIPDSILQKQDALTEQELTRIHQHVQVGAEVVSSIPSLRTLAPIIQSHHEWWNGMGYPQQQAGDTIPFGARLLAVVDAYVAMTHAEPYSEANSQVKVLAELRRGAGTQFDPAIVEQFLGLLTSMQTNTREQKSAA